MPRPRPLPAISVPRSVSKKPADYSRAQWEAVLVAGDRALFAHRMIEARRRENCDQASFAKIAGVSQQIISEWERGYRAQVTTEMLHLGGFLAEISAANMLKRPTDLYDDEGRVFWTAVAVELAAVRDGAPRPTIKEILQAAEQARRTGGA